MAKVKSSKKSGFSKRKAGLGGLFKSAKKNFENEGDPFGMTVPNGPYIATISAAERRESGGDQYISWQACVEEGEQEGAIIGWRSNLTTEENLKWLLINFSRMGVDVSDLEIEDNDDLDQILTELVDAAPKVRLVANSDSGYQNVNINKLISVGEGTAEEPEAEEGEEVDWEGEQAGYRKGKKLYVGTVTEVNEKKGTFVMETEEGKTVKGDVDDLEKPEAEAEEEAEVELEKGDKVEGDIDGTSYPGEIKKVKGDQITIKFEDGDTDTLDASDVTKLEAEAEGDEDPDEVDLEIGAEVEVTYNKKDYAGKVKALNEKDEEVTVYIKKLKKKVTVPVDDVAVV